MPRPKRGTPAGDRATERWKETMQKRYGGASQFMEKIGAKGGRMGRTGGFAANIELAREAGAKGGRLSRRTSKSYKNDWNKKKDAVLKEYYKGEISMAELARKYNLPYSTVRKGINEN